MVSFFGGIIGFALVVGLIFLMWRPIKRCIYRLRHDGLDDPLASDVTTVSYNTLGSNSRWPWPT